MLQKFLSFKFPILIIFFSILISLGVFYSSDNFSISQTCSSLPKYVTCSPPSQAPFPSTCPPSSCHFFAPTGSLSINVTCSQYKYQSVTVTTDYCDTRQTSEICSGVSFPTVYAESEISNGCNTTLTNPSLEPYCGDGFCTGGESYSSCSADCTPGGGHTRRYTPGDYDQNSMIFTVNPMSRTISRGGETVLYNLEVYASGIYSGSLTGTFAISNCPTNATCTIDGDSSFVYDSSNSDTFVTKILRVTTTASTPVNTYQIRVDLNFLDFSRQQTAFLTVQDYLLSPTLFIDNPQNGASVSGVLNVAGWAIDNQYTRETAITSRRVYVNNVFVGNATTYNRQDVCNVYPSRVGCPNVGFAYALDTTTLSNGSHTLRFEAVDSDTVPKTATVTRTINVNNSTSGTIQGYKVKSTNFSTTDNPPSSQTVTLNGSSPTTANPFSFSNITLGTNYTVSVSVPSGWTSGYTICYGNTSCHSGAPTSGSSVVVNIPTSLPLGQRYADIYWRLTPPVNNPPVITLNGSNPTTITAGTSWTDPGATATDAQDGNLTSAIVITGTVNTSVVGTYTKTYSVTDSGGLTASVTRTINVVAANTAPVITLNGSNPTTITAGTSWTDPGATATDAQDGNLTSAIVITGTVNTSVVGTYTKTYSVTDSGGLTASVTRTINVLNSGSYSLVVNRSTGGRVNSADGNINCGSVCSAIYAQNTNVTLTATPLSAQWLFVGWSGACSGTSTTCVVNMSSSRTVGAEFRPRPFDYQEF